MLPNEYPFYPKTMLYPEPFVGFSVIDSWDKNPGRFKDFYLCSLLRKHDDFVFIHYIGGAGRFMENVRR